MRLRLHAVGVARIALIGAMAFFFLAGGPSSGPRAQAVGGNAGPVTVTVEKTADGQGITARAEAPAGVLIYEIVAHTCITGSNVRTTSDFGFQGRKCTNAPVGGGDVEQLVELPNGAGAAEIPYFRIGTGTTRWVNSRGYDQAITCGPGQPCDVVIQLQVTDGTVYYPATLCFDAVCPAGTVGETPPPSPPAAPVVPVAPVAGTESPAVTPAPGAAKAGKVPTAAAASDATSVDKPAAGGSASASNGDPDGDAARSSGISLSTVDGGRAQATRVRAAAVAGLAGGVLIVGLISRGRRQMEESSSW